MELRKETCNCDLLDNYRLAIDAGRELDPAIGLGAVVRLLHRLKGTLSNCVIVLCNVYLPKYKGQATMSTIIWAKNITLWQRGTCLLTAV